MGWKSKNPRTSGVSLLVFVTLLFSDSSAPASALWGVLPGKVLGRMGEAKIVPEEGKVWTVEINPSTATSPDEGTSFDTTEDGKGIFFGTIGNQVTIRRQADSGAVAEWTLGKLNTGLKSKGGVRDGKAWLEDQFGYSQVTDEADEDADDDGEVYAGSTVDIVDQVCENCVWKFYPAQADQSPYAGTASEAFAPLPVSATLPSYFLTQNSIKTEVWECVPLAKKGYWPMMSALNGVHWHAAPEPLVRAIGEFGSAPVHWKAKGWWQGPVDVIATAKSLEVRSSSMNNVTLVDALEMWPCDMLLDYYVPGGEMALSDIPGSDTMLVSWDARYYCSESSPDQITPTSTPQPTPTPPPDKANSPPTVQLKASLDQAGLNQNISFQANGRDPDGDFLKYTFFVPGEGWTPYRGASTIVRKFAKEGNPKITVMVSDGKAPPVSDSVSVKIADPVWDAIVLYRYYSEAWLTAASAENVRNHAVKKKLNAVLSSVEWGGSDVKFKNGMRSDMDGEMMFMDKKGMARKALNWMLGQEGMYRKLVKNVTAKKDAGGEMYSKDAVVVMTRIDPATGKRVYESGHWDNFAPKGTDFSTTWRPTRGRDLSTEWQTKDNKTLQINGRSVKINVAGYQYWSSPIILDLTFSGEPDLLAGPNAWKKGRSTIPEKKNARKFDLDRTGEKYWEWVGPTAGILVWGDPSRGLMDATRLFGNHTWGRDWKDGYEPLSVLDKDNNGVLQNEELDHLFVWTDSDVNGLCSKEEAKSLADLGIVAISASPTRDDIGNAHSESGFSTSSGKTGSTWDWWSSGFPDSPSPSANTKISTYAWAPMKTESPIPGGMFIFEEYSGGRIRLASFVPLEEFSQSDEEAAVIGTFREVTKEGNRMRWEDDGDGIIFRTDAMLEGDNIVGVTRAIRDGLEVDNYSWLAVPMSAPPVPNDQKDSDKKLE